MYLHHNRVLFSDVIIATAEDQKRPIAIVEKDYQGFLQTGNLVAFNKTRHKLSLNPKEEEDVMIAQKAFTGSDFEGWICKECGLVTFDYTNVITHW